MLKNKIFSIVLALALLMPAMVMAEDIYSNILNPPQAVEVPLTQTSATEPVQSDDLAVQNEKQAVQEPAVKSDGFKQPISRKKIAKKFLLAMAGVLISSLLIFFILTFYNRLREKFLNQIKTPEGETSLETPDDLEGAVRSFLDKTNWG